MSERFLIGLGARHASEIPLDVIECGLQHRKTITQIVEVRSRHNRLTGIQTHTPPEAASFVGTLPMAIAAIQPGSPDFGLNEPTPTPLAGVGISG